MWSFSQFWMAFSRKTIQVNKLAEKFANFHKHIHWIFGTTLSRIGTLGSTISSWQVAGQLSVASTSSVIYSRCLLCWHKKFDLHCPMAEVDDYRPSEVTAAAVLQLLLSHTKKLFLAAQKPENKYLAKTTSTTWSRGGRGERGLNMMILGSQSSNTAALLLSSSAKMERDIFDSERQNP